MNRSSFAFWSLGRGSKCKFKPLFTPYEHCFLRRFRLESALGLDSDPMSFERPTMFSSNMERYKGLHIREDVFAQLPAWARTILRLVGEGPLNFALVHLDETANRG